MRHDVPAHGMQALRGGIQLGISVTVVLRNQRRCVAIGNERGSGTTGTAYNLRKAWVGAVAQYAATMHIALEPKPLRCAVPNKQERQEVLHSRPGQGTIDTLNKGYGGTLGQHALGGRRQGRGNADRNYSDVLRPHEKFRRLRRKPFVPLPVRLPEEVQKVLRADSRGACIGLPSATCAAVLDAGDSRRGRKEPGHRLRMARAVGVVDADCKPHGA